MERVRALWNMALARGRATYNRIMRWVVRHVPPGARTLVGLLFVAGGVLGFLPILGFWMLPLGIAVILLDVTMVRRWQRGRPIRWRRRTPLRPGDGAP